MGDLPDQFYALVGRVTVRTTELDMDFTIESPAGFAEHLHAIAARYERTAIASAPTTIQSGP